MQLREIMHRPELAEAAMENYTKARRASVAGDERVVLQEFLAEIKKMYDLSPKAAEKMLFIYEKTMRQRKEKAEQAAEQAAEAPAVEVAAKTAPPAAREADDESAPADLLAARSADHLDEDNTATPQAESAEAKPGE